jgi:hypothetical protein
MGCVTTSRACPRPLSGYRRVDSFTRRPGYARARGRQPRQQGTPADLLPQPGGFEGFPLAAKGGPPDHLPVSQQTGLPHRLLDRDAAQCSSHPEMRDAPVARSANVDQLPSHVLKRAANALPPRPNALVTPKVVPSASATIEVNSTSSAVSARNALKSPALSAPNSASASARCSALGSNIARPVSAAGGRGATRAAVAADAT